MIDAVGYSRELQQSNNQGTNNRDHLWQGRFASDVLDEQHLLTATRYVEMDPVKAGLVSTPRQYRWSSARAHLTGPGAGPIPPECICLDADNDADIDLHDFAALQEDFGTTP